MKGFGDRVVADGRSSRSPAPRAGDVNIGAQLRAARLAARMSLADVAAQSQLTKGFVSRLERDQANASVAALMRLCNTLGISAGSLFQAAKGEVIRRGEYPPINFGGDSIHEYLLTSAGEKRVQAILSEIDSGGGSGSEAYSLPADVEFVYVLSGQLELTVAGELVVLDRGDAFTFPPSTEHSFRATRAGSRTKVLWVFSPALSDEGLGDMFRARGAARR